MLKHKLGNKLITTFISVLSVGLIILGIFLTLWFKSYFFNETMLEIDRESDFISAAATSYITMQEKSSFNNLQTVINMVSNSIDGDILVADTLGYTYAVSNEDHEEKKFSNIGLTDKQMESLKSGESIKVKEINSDGIKVYNYLKPVFKGDYFGGIIVVITPVKNVSNVIFKVCSIIWILIFIIIAITTISVCILTKNIIIKPISEMNRVANKLAKGEVCKRVSIENKDEIGELAASFNIMAESIEQADRNRKEFISNVSHELRSPITSIKGFLSGILDGIIPKDKENYYLNIVYDEINRLSRLVCDLLDISTLENGKLTLNMMELDINLLIKICLANKESNIVNKDLKVEVILEKEHEFVYADRDRIIQVITNLLDNAIKYSHDGGSIKINTKGKGNKVYVDIKNQGPKLSNEELVRIWDRFYKSDKSRTNKESTGLGLPIVRSILTQHGEDIWTKNDKDGVCFTFTLSKK